VVFNSRRSNVLLARTLLTTLGPTVTQDRSVDIVTTLPTGRCETGFLAETADVSSLRRPTQPPTEWVPGFQTEGKAAGA